MGTKDKVANVGQKGLLKFAGFQVEVEIKDYKNSYGKDRWLVAPVAGNGEIWTEQEVVAN